MRKPTHIGVSALISLNLLTLLCSSGNATLLNSSTDAEALIAFKSRITSDPFHLLAKNWSTTTSICSWLGVSCAPPHHRVTALSLFNTSLGGTVAPHLGNLSYLRSLDLGLNKFTGILPHELSNLGRLRTLHLDFNNFTGDVPPWLGALAQLQVASLQNNSFTGAIPNLLNLSKLERLDLSYNSISGNIPTELGNLTNLRSLDMKFNHLTGSLPPSVLNSSTLEILDISSNILTGTLPMDMCDNLPKLQGLFLSLNQLSGLIPSNLHKCTSLQRLSMSRNQFNGSIPREIGKLVMLRNLYLGTNILQGGIPAEFGNLSRLETLSMQESSLTGEIPSFIFNISSLKEIDLSYNNLSGRLPPTINLPNLDTIFLNSNHLTGGEALSALLDCHKVRLLQLSKNLLTGAIPKKVSNMTSLRFLFLNENKMTGEIPAELGSINLERLTMAYNGFSGSVPLSIFNISSMVELNLAFNELSGEHVASMGSSLPNLELLYLNNNSFTGPFPSYIANASKLSLIEIGSNSFTGLVPDLGNLRHLNTLFFTANNLRGSRFISSLQNCPYLKRLDFSLNQLNDIIPDSVGNLSTSLEYFRAFGCGIKGYIPAGFGNLSSLRDIELDSNELRGSIPTEIGKLEDLQAIYLEHNRLEGNLPPQLCNISRLMDLYLSGNMLSGEVPSCLGKTKSLRRIFLDSNRLNSMVPDLWGLTDLWSLNLSNNMLTGEISPEIQNMKVLRHLDLSWNRLSGDIPSSIGDTESLETLSLAHNSLGGSIPSSLGNLRGLVSQNLSNNNLLGMIPTSLEGLRFLKYLDVSYNTLEGEIPAGGGFASFPAQSFMHNYALCGVTRLRVAACRAQTVGRSSSKHASEVIKYVVVPVVSVVIFLLAASLWIIRRRRRASRRQHPAIGSIVSEWRRVSYQELKQATEDFSQVNFLGSGSFGAVFKGMLWDGLNVAVKVFDMQLEKAITSFDIECEILSSIRHRNLVRVISCCSSLDFKAMVLEYMPNGSLEKWLYSHNYCLDLQQRMSIAIDVAAALEYLHHGNKNPIVHCDLKPSNVLLEHDMTAHVADFGVSKLFNEGEILRQTATLATVGYMAPEYGLEGRVSTNGDVYSYGILLLEMFTRKKPTGLLLQEDQHLSAKEQCVSSILRVATRCVASSPPERSNMKEVVASLNKIRNQFLATTATRATTYHVTGS